MILTLKMPAGNLLANENKMTVTDLLTNLRLPIELHHGIDEGFAIDGINPNCPGVPIKESKLVSSSKEHSVEIFIVWKFKLVGRAAMFEVVAVKCVGLVEDLHQIGNDHIVEGAFLW